MRIKCGRILGTLKVPCVADVFRVHGVTDSAPVRAMTGSLKPTDATWLAESSARTLFATTKAHTQARCSIVQFRIPIFAAPFRRHVKDSPERHQIRRAARILSGIDRGAIHLTGPEMPDGPVPPREHVEGCIVAAILG